MTRKTLRSRSAEHPRQKTQEASSSVLIVGYGNLSRRDDGVAFHILRRLREQLGLPGCALGEGEDDWGGRLAMIGVHQLAPELAENLSQYEVVVFVDAHVASTEWAPVHWQEVVPAYEPTMVSHHLKPASVLALCQLLFERCPKAFVLSVLGSDFDFGEQLSPKTSALADRAVARLSDLLRSEGIVPRTD